MKDKTDLCEASYGDVIDGDYKVVILPWGAIEPHNYHLPYITDALLSHAVSKDAAQRLYLTKGILSIVMPPVYYGSQNPGQRDVRFCIHSRYQTQNAILRDIVDSLLCQGYKKLLIVNGHGGNSFKNMLRDLAVDYPDFKVCCCEWYSLAEESDFFDSKGEHAHELETSVMMHYYPHLVDINQAGTGESKRITFNALANGYVWMPRNWKEISNDTGIGDPSKATMNKGKAFADKVSEKLQQIIEEFSY